MSWLGVNLNESLNSIKGQISSFTKDVLAEEEAGGGGAEILIPKNLIKEYEASIMLHKEEIKELKSSRAEAEDRMRATDYHCSQKINDLKQQLHDVQEELNAQKNKFSAWAWESEGGKLPPNMYFRPDESNYEEKILSLEKELEWVRSTHDEAMAASLLAHQKQIDQTTKQAKHDSNTSMDTPTLEICDENEKDHKIILLEEELGSLRTSYNALFDEKEQLNTNLVDLDNEHQLNIDEILKSKKQLVEELKETKSEITQLKNGRAPELSLNEAPVLVESGNEQQQLLQAQRKWEDEHRERVDELERTISLQTEQIRALTGKLDDEATKNSASGAEVNRLTIVLKDYEKTTAIRENESAVKEEAARKANEDLRLKIETLERDYGRRGHNINELKDKIISQEEEILKFEAVLEEKNLEHEAAFRRLKQHEEMTKITIQDFQNQIQDLKRINSELEEKNKKEELTKLQKASADKTDNTRYEVILKELVTACNAQSFEDLPSALTDLNSEVAYLRCERDRLSEDLRNAQELIDNQEAEKTELERESEDLRDQLEELQCGERAPPEGSLTPRSLPTIEEEEVEGYFSSQAEMLTKEGNSGFKDVKPTDLSDFDLVERLNQLNSQVAALGEARQNLELELSLVKKERGELEQRFSEANSQLGNLSNLEVEAITLRSENESLQAQLNDSRNLLQKCSGFEEERTRLERQIQQMTNAMDKMNFDTAHSLSKEDEFYKERAQLLETISTQNKTIHEYFYEISQLRSVLNENKNASALAEEYQRKVVSLEADLDKVKGLVIYKDDQIDQLRHGVEQIGEVFDLKDQDLRQTYVRVKQEYLSLKRNLNAANEEIENFKAIQGGKELNDEASGDKEIIQNLSLDLEGANDRYSEAQKELETLKELRDSGFKELEEELAAIKAERNQRLLENDDILKRQTFFEGETERLQQRVNTLSENVTEADSALQRKEEEISKIKKESLEKDSVSNEKISSLEKAIASKNKNIDYLNGLLAQIPDQKAVVGEHELAHLQRELKETTASASELSGENETLKKQVLELQNEKQQMIVASTQKHHESVTYYNEIQRLNDAMSKENEKLHTLSQLLRTETEAKMSAIDNATNLIQQLDLLKKESTPKSEALNLTIECQRKDEEIKKLSDELSKLQELYRTVVKERDHLRFANSSFNSQYEEKSKELVALQEKEKYLQQEAQRLKEHLVEVEETYTELVEKGKEQEATLRQSLAKAHEKMASHSTHYSNANQKTSAQLELIQDQLAEAIHQRDEARSMLQESEEASLQHQEALTRLQQVLQDFQKSQTRDIVTATEREKRKYAEEKEKNAELEAQKKALVEKLQEAETALATAAVIRAELQAKEDMVVALKSQVNAIQLASKKNQEKFSLLQSSSEGKVDKHLVRNLIVGYFATPSDKQHEVLRVVAEVLDFSPEERSRTGTDQPPGSWLTSISNFLAPPPSNIRIASKVDVLDHSSLSQAFIRFLEEESLPRTQPKLPAVEMAEEASQKAQKKAKSKLLQSNTFVSSGGTYGDDGTNSLNTYGEPSNALLFSSTPSMQENYLLIPPPANITTPIMNSEEMSTPKFLNNLLNSSKTEDEINS